MLALLTILLLLSSVFVEQIPDYDKPSVPIYFDKDTYTWTDKVRITIPAHAWNADRYSIDSIGDDSEHPIKISTPSHSLDQYKLTETAPNSGIFSGEITLTGFSHDVDGDGRSDLTPRTTGNGPTSGLLEVDRDDGITLSFELVEGIVVTKSVHVSWNIGEVEFSNPNYLESDAVVARVIDPDMNLNPESLDDVEIDVSSDSDSAGTTITATETDEESGVFEATITLTQNDESSGNRLRALPSDSITAIYHDRTLPEPYSIQDEQDITAKSLVDSNTPSTQRMSISDIFLADSSGNHISTPKQNEQFQIVSQIQNTQNYSQDFTNLIQITNENGEVVSLSWIVGNLNQSQQFEISQSWLPKEKGTYTIEIFVWKSLDDATPLSETQTQTITIE